MSNSHELTWGELADIYDAHNSGRRARTLPMERVTLWAVNRPDLFRVLDNGSFVRVKAAKQAAGASNSPIGGHETLDAYLDTLSTSERSVAERALSLVGTTPAKQCEAHVIQCNDSVQFVVIGSVEAAKEKRDELREAYYVQNKWNFRGRKEYDNRCYWAVRTVPCEEKA